jgi:hypothetical protein
VPRSQTSPASGVTGQIEAGQHGTVIPEVLPGIPVLLNMHRHDLVYRS